MNVARVLHSVARDIVDRRDGNSGWKPHREALLRSVRKDAATLRADVDRALDNILHHAHGTVGYYRDSWRQAGFEGAAPTALELERLPFLTKEDIRSQRARLVSSQFRIDELELSCTGGTTGTQTAFHMDHACRVSRVGRQIGIQELCGYQRGMRRALVWGVHADLQQGDRRTLKQRLRQFASNEEVLCCTVMGEAMMAEYHARLVGFRPQVLYGYPSALVELGRFIRDTRRSQISVQTIITTAERLMPAQRTALQSMFSGEVFNLYCTREYGCIGFECARHEGFHVDSESVFVEIIKDGRRAPPDQHGEITITDLKNRGMPFIRSRTGDLGSLVTKPCECGLALPRLTGLDGRATDFILRPDGARVAGLMLTDLFMQLPAIRMAQFVQEKPGQLEVLVVASDNFGAELQHEVIRQVRELVGHEMEINVRRVADIPRNPRSGKYREVISSIGSVSSGVHATFPVVEQASAVSSSLESGS